MANVAWTESAKEDLQKLDQPIQKRIVGKISWFQDNFEYLIPQSLSGDFQDLYKLRVGDWRIIYDLKGEREIIIRFIGHRSDIYE